MLKHPYLPEKRNSPSMDLILSNDWVLWIHIWALVFEQQKEHGVKGQNIQIFRCIDSSYKNVCLNEEAWTAFSIPDFRIICNCVKATRDGRADGKISLDKIWKYLKPRMGRRV